MTQEYAAVMAACCVPFVRQMGEVSCVVGEDDPCSLGDHTQLKLIGLAKMVCVSCHQAVNAMLGQNCGKCDRYRFIHIEFHGMAGAAG